MNNSYHNKKNKIINPINPVKKNTNSYDPKVIGDYMIGEKLGQGTFSKVYLGTHILTREKV